MTYDLIIVGSGPAGLSAALCAKASGLSYLILEQGDVAETIRGYPLARRLFSTSEEVELQVGALERDVKPLREDVLSHYTGLVEQEEINILIGQQVRRIHKGGELFEVHTESDSYAARTVLVAIGGFGQPRKLGVAGEEPGRVSYRFIEAAPYTGKTILVVGGGNSAAEASLALMEAGANVILSRRRSSLGPSDEALNNGSPAPATIKPWVREPLEHAVSEGLIRLIPTSAVTEIRSNSATLKVSRGNTEELVEVECDHIFALIGADPDTRLLEGAGAKMASDGRPVYDTESYETTVAGLFVAGHITRDLHMKNAGPTARRVVDSIAVRLLKSRNDP
jgi:thioredoxin reductase (NADPH)